MADTADYLVVKRNELNELRLLDTPLLTPELKVANALISLISPDDDELKSYRLTVSELGRLTGSNNMHRDIERICNRLMRVIVTFRRAEGAGFVKVPFFARSEYAAEESYIDFRFSADLKPYLLKLKSGFTKYQLKQITSLSSAYSIRLYELLRQFLPINRVAKGQRTAFREIAIADLREFLGVEPDRYSRMYDFKRFVVNHAQKELSKKTDLFFTYTPAKRGKHIVALRFNIQDNSKPVPESSAEVAYESLPVCENETMLRMVKMSIPNIPERNAILLANSYSQDVLTEALLGLMEAGEEVRNPVAYLMGILKNKRRDEAQPPARKKKTTEEKLTDRSWVEGLQLEEWD